VSVRDYRDFARVRQRRQGARSGSSGPARGLFLTIAGERGAAIAETSDTFVNLQDALRRYGDPLLPLVIRLHRRAVPVRASVKVADDADATLVLPAIGAALRRPSASTPATSAGVSVDG
jgi:hypothetical protein